nr:MAG TPA: hypothetical protein [Caudoviricetes sp.]
MDLYQNHCRNDYTSLRAKKKAARHDCYRTA